MGEWAIGAAFLLDLILGDPPSWPHPVRWIGWLIDRLVQWAEGWADSRERRKQAGVVIVIIVVGASWALTTFILDVVGSVSSVLGACLWVWIAYTTLATRSLYDQTWRVVIALKENDLPRARRLLSMVVGRQTEHLSREEVIRAVIETIAENLSDGVIAPLFFLWLGGPSAAIAYKAVNTMDSMIGYKNDRFIDLGWAAARLDDVVNYIPARLSALLIVVVSFILRLDARGSLSVWWKEGRNHTSPNAGRPEAALAGALGIKLGGPSVYHGRLVEKPTIGQARFPLDTHRVLLAERVMIASSGLMAVLIIVIG